MRRTTIRDVAERAGVGKVTVSYVLNGRSRSARISKETEAKVLAAAKELAYRPNAVARMLATQRTSILAVVFQYATLFAADSGFINQVMRGACFAAVEEGFDLMLHTKTVLSSDAEADVLTDGRVDGVLILRDPDDPTLANLIARDFPTVQFFTKSNHPNAAWVDADNTAGGRLAAEHLLSLGHRKFAMVAGPPGSAAANDRLNGFRGRLAESGLLLSDDHVVRVGNPLEVDALQSLFQREDRPTAIFAWADDVAIASMDLLASMGLRCPQDFSIVGFDSLDICNRCRPGLTSVAQPISEMAATAVRLLSQLVKGKTPVTRQVLFPLRLDVRGSTAPVAPTVPNEVNPYESARFSVHAD
jgi:LacI family transcriptional regulator